MPVATLAWGRTRLLLLSFLMLFLELALIRWLGAHVVYLSYFSNFVLLGAFLGIGIGFLRAGRGRSLAPAAPLLLCALVVFAANFPVEVDHRNSELIFFGQDRTLEGALTGLPIYVTLPAIFVAVAAVMAAIAQSVGELFARFRPLDAYRIDIAGSLLGIVGFAVASFLGAPPVVWASLVGALMAVLVVMPWWQGSRGGMFAGADRQRRRRTLLAAVQVAALGVVVVTLGAESRRPDTIWSPYYKITLRTVGEGATRAVGVSVNGVPHQEITSTENRLKIEGFYALPYEKLGATQLDDVLVIGAGNGSDVALALQNGARRVDAVEIDRELLHLGRRLNPDRPYQDPRVHVHITDGRAFLERTDRRYDLILFALPDSLTLVSGQSALRLESYLFTTEAIDEARRHLKPGGMFSMYNFYREEWLAGRLGRTLAESFGHAPCMSYAAGNHLAVMAIGTTAGQVQCSALWSRERLDSPSPARDDMPFLYLKGRTIPSLYLAALGMVLLVSVVAVPIAAGGVRPMAGFVDLFFMGSAFLLLETRSIVQFALLFGTTWLVNALVFASILASVLLAIEVSRRWRPVHVGALYAALLVALAIAFVVPQHVLLQLDVGPRLLVAGALAFAPVFIANLIFAERFRDTANSTVAFGANLLGAMVGGVLEYAALVTGYRMLLVVVAALYGLAFLAGRRHIIESSDVRSG